MNHNLHDNSSPSLRQETLHTLLRQPLSPHVTIDLASISSWFDRSQSEPLLLVGQESEIIFTAQGSFPWASPNNTRLLDCLHAMERGIFQDWLRAIIKEMPVSYGEFVFLSPEGGLVSYEFSGFRCTDPAHEQRVLIFGRQRCSQNQPEFSPANYAAKGAPASNTLKHNVIGNISHELRTPLNGIAGAAEVLTQSNLNESQMEMLRCILDSSNALLEILTEMGDYAAITSGYASFDQEAFTLDEFIQSVHSRFSETASSKGLSFKVERDGGIPDELIGDRDNLWRIISRLVGNAIKFTTTGEVLIRIGNRGVDEHTASIIFEVVDTGAGIEEGALEWICDPFRQAAPAHENKTRGLGLGLATCQLLAMRAQTRLCFESSVGEGSRFWVSLRFRIAEKGSIPRTATD